MIKNNFLQFAIKNVCSWYSLKLPCRGNSNEYPQVFLRKNMKILSLKYNHIPTWSISLKYYTNMWMSLWILPFILSTNFSAGFKENSEWIWWWPYCGYTVPCGDFEVWPSRDRIAWVACDTAHKAWSEDSAGFGYWWKVTHGKGITDLSHLMTKPTKWSVYPAKTQISLGICPVWSVSSLCAQWAAEDPLFLYADSEDYDQTGRMPGLIWVLVGCSSHFVGFVMRWLIWIINWVVI